MKIYLARDKNDGEGTDSCVSFYSHKPKMIVGGEHDGVWNCAPKGMFCGFISSSDTQKAFGIEIKKGECIEYDMALTQTE
jgi:hypothetical protein